jgi:putative phage-type endonuclease
MDDMIENLNDLIRQVDKLENGFYKLTELREDIEKKQREDENNKVVKEERKEFFGKKQEDARPSEPDGSAFGTLVSSKINKLREIPQADQRTDEWFSSRHNMLTASTIWKIFKSQASLNSIIYEKCSPPKKQITAHTLQWGQQFEPISIMLYERRFSTKVGQFGCIPHRDYPFLGASPDGINIDPSSLKFGTMIEVKNIVNRLITDKPKEEYWIQMQIQMEVCDLDMCDFIETRFKKVDDDEKHEEFLENIQTDELVNYEKGIILIGYFGNDYTPHNHYYNVNITLNESENVQMKDDLEKWIQGLMTTEKYTHHKMCCWYLDEFSCISIQRDMEWFAKSMPKIKETWETIVIERQTNNYHHRKPKSRNVAPHANLFDTPVIFEGK